MKRKGSVVLSCLLTFSFASAPMAQAPVGSPDLRIDPPRMLYWANLLGTHPDRWICQMLKDNAIVEADERQKRLAQLLPCARGWRGKWMRYTLLFTWNCSGSVGGKCPYWRAQIYGDNELVPEKALLHHLRGGSVTCKGTDGKPLTVSWKAGDPWDARHQANNPNYQACGSIGRRGAGTHMIVNPVHPWTKESVLRYVKNRLQDGYSLARIDEVTVAWNLDWSDVAEYPPVGDGPGGSRTRYLRDQGALLESMRDVKGWIATCPSTHRFWEKDAMILNAAGGCGSAEDFPSGTGLRVNWGNKLTVGEARAKWGPSILNKESDHARPNNFKHGVGYDSSRRNIEGAAMMVRRAMESNNPNLIWLMYCSNLVGSGETLQEAVGAGGDRIYCNDMGDLTDPVSGRRPVWYEYRAGRPHLPMNRHNGRSGRVFEPIGRHVDIRRDLSQFVDLSPGETPDSQRQMLRSRRMAWVIARLCRDCVDQSCVKVCPVDCIYEYTGDDREAFPNQLYIDPDECINCSVCEPECPWEAIFEDSAVPDPFKDDIALNNRILEAKADFRVPEAEEMDRPTPDQVAENKRKWGLEP